MNKKQFIQPDYMKVDADSGEILYEEQRTTEFSLMSKNLGKKWLTEERIKFYKENKLGVIVDDGGQFKSMPRYFKDKIFTKSEKLDIAEEFADQFDKDYNEIIEKLGQTEADIENGLLNIKSPIARALIGKEEGDSVEVRTPGGVKDYEILTIAFK